VIVFSGHVRSGKWTGGKGWYLDIGWILTLPLMLNNKTDTKAEHKKTPKPGRPQG